MAIGLILFVGVVGFAQLKDSVQALTEPFQSKTPPSVISVIPRKENNYYRRILTINLSNPGENQVVFKDFLVSTVAMGAAGGGSVNMGRALTSNADYKIDYTVGGDTRYQLDPPYVIPPESVGAFTIHLHPVNVSNSMLAAVSVFLIDQNETMLLIDSQ